MFESVPSTAQATALPDKRAAPIAPPAGLLGVALAALFLYRTSTSAVDPDLWHEMALAREIVQSGRVPWGDNFAYTPTLYPVVHHEWGAGVIAYLLASAFGGAGIVALKLALTAALAALVVLIARRRGASLEVFAFLAPLGILLVDEGFATVRAQMYSMTLTAGLAWCLDRDREGRRLWIPFWLVLYTAWVNLHAGFLVGVGLLAADAMGRMWRGQKSLHLFGVGLAMSMLVAVNPYGLEYYRYLVRAVTLDRPHVAEWAPLWNNPGEFVLFAAAAGLAAYAARCTGVRNAVGIEMLLAAAAESLLHARMTVFFAILWTSFVPGWIEKTPVGAAIRGIVREKRALVAVVFAAILAASLARVASARPWILRVPSEPTGEPGVPYYPVGAATFLAERGFRGNLMTPFDWGGYLSYKLGPDVKVSLDGRYEVAYSPDLELESHSFYMARPGWESVLAKYPTDLLLVPRALPLADRLPGKTGWRLLYEDDAFLVFARPGHELPPPSRGALAIEAFP